ncbi:hypothetical protein SAMN04515647_1391 [Cohaesibacter sp. ES.047]|uniref:hypothetical protein n=1 Tax=Cohaesibacter sp. ES.047 TaxID=1798205 RepID=UPI000BB9082F|nr:hypothetical protein [Cohaesibacter sp. ES.047]SNY91178.1 hypothetical protein SAMN04515647_1391 [Cohaesibacter sp. ES.047]
MQNRVTTSIIHFDHPFQFSGSDKSYPPGDYKLTREDEAIEGISWMAYRCKSICIDVPSIGRAKGKTERYTVAQDELTAMVHRDSSFSERSLS